MRLNTTDYSDFHGGVKCEETHFKKLDLFIYLFIFLAKHIRGTHLDMGWTYWIRGGLVMLDYGGVIYKYNSTPKSLQSVSLHLDAQLFEFSLNIQPPGVLTQNRWNSFFFYNVYNRSEKLFCECLFVHRPGWMWVWLTARWTQTPEWWTVEGFGWPTHLVLACFTSCSWAYPSSACLWCGL